MQPTPPTPPARKKGLLATKHPYVVGLSYEGLPTMAAAANESDTGLYLDELDDLNLKMVEASKPNVQLGQMMQQSRSDAYGQLETDVMATLRTMNGPQLGQYAGIIGGPGTYEGVVDVPNGTELSLKLWPAFGTGATVSIKRIGLLLAADAEVLVRIGSEPEPFKVVAVADTPSFYTFAPPLQIPLAAFDDDTDCNYCYDQTSGAYLSPGERPLVISYTVNGFMARNNSTSCGCTAMDNRLASFFTNALKQPANGILLDVEVGQSEAQVITDGYETSLVIQNVIGYAVRYKAAELLVERIINSTEINRYTTLDQQFLWGKRNEFRKEYQTRVNWLVSGDGLRTVPNPENPARGPQIVRIS